MAEIMKLDKEVLGTCVSSGKYRTINMNSRLYIGNYIINNDWDTYAVITHGNDVYLVALTVPHGTMVSITRNGKIRVTAAKILSIINFDTERTMSNGVQMKRNNVEPGPIYCFDLYKNTFFVTQRLRDAYRIIEEYKKTINQLTD